ncbi:putative glucosylceramidase 4 [Oppia nitens]|uniref:putative glucosylceramidase 4 n=1 Tax=Oppia nitens TaxID=1686743 RepID=UPI0023DBDBE6|nr:putative glucosylceramidase 4 [Oppia nitens]
MHLIITKLTLILYVLATLLLSPILSRNPCAGRPGETTVYCVCNQTYCDNVEPIVRPVAEAAGTALIYRSSQSGQRLDKSLLNFTDKPHGQSPAIITIDSDKRYQTVLGIGAAFTDAATINIQSLPKPMASRLVSDYFDPETGIGFSMGRIPIAGCDFSTHEYTYDDIADDYELREFALTKEDFDDKIPIIKLAQTLSGHRLKLFASPWNTPHWLNDKKKIAQDPAKHYGTWANYFIKFLDAYKSYGINLWGLTIQNEPMSFSSMNFLNASIERDFLKNYLGPALALSGYTPDKLHVLVYDDGSDRNPIVDYVDTCLSDKQAAQYVSGIAYHCYLGSKWQKIPVLKERYPGMMFLMSECCQNFRLDQKPEPKPSKLGKWEQGADYAEQIVRTFNQDVNGWVEWNLALDTYGHPNKDHKAGDAPVLINASNGEYYKNPNFYVLGHFSKFIEPQSVRIDAQLTKPLGSVGWVAFRRPDGSTTLVVYNNGNQSHDLAIYDHRLGYLSATLDEHSIQSYVYWH